MRAYHLSPRSGNAKTGPIATTTSSRDNCPTCPFKRDGCYADGGKMALFWNTVTAGGGTSGAVEVRTQTIAQHIAAVRDVRADMIRLNQAGDLPGSDDVINANQALRLAGAAAHNGRTAWTYTHYPLTPDNADVVRAMIDAGTTVNVSANSVRDAVAKRRKHFLPTTAVVPRDFEPGRYGAHGRRAKSGVKFAVCPAQTSKSVTCKTCGNGSPLCSRSDRDYVIAFRAHGSGARKAEETTRRT